MVEYIQPETYYSNKDKDKDKDNEIGFKNSFRFFFEEKSPGVIVGPNTGAGSGGPKKIFEKFKEFSDNEIADEKPFIGLKEQINQLWKGPKDTDKLYKIIELVFRIKDNMSKTNYIISNELNYLRLIK